MTFVEILLGPSYFGARRFINKTEYFSYQQHKKYQSRILSHLLKFAIREIPFYQEKCMTLFHSISENNSLDHLKYFPYSSKEIIRENFHKFISNGNFRRMKVQTGATSGVTLTFYIDRLLTRRREKAFIWNQWGRVGYKPGDKIASFRGVIPKTGKSVEFNRLFNTYVFSPFELTEKNIGSIFSILNKIKPSFLHGYPSSITQLAKLIKGYAKTLEFFPKAALCGSEKMYPGQRELIEDVFKCRVYTWYGHSECAVLGGECEYSSTFHLFPQYGYVEFLPTNITHHSGEKLFEIVGTGFNNRVMPFIKYRTGDYAILDNFPCACGRNYPMIKEVVGRFQEFLVDCDGNLVSATAFISLFDKIPLIDEFFIVQKSPGEVELQIISAQTLSNNSDRIINEIISKIFIATHSKIKAEVKIVNEMPNKAKSGKQLVVEQEIDLKPYLSE